MVFDIGVAYKEDVDNVMKVMREVGADLQNDELFSASIIEPLEIFGLDKFDDSALVIKARIQNQTHTAMGCRKGIPQTFENCIR
jgi:moderate conductance mechanosensitive channel